MIEATPCPVCGSTALARVRTYPNESGHVLWSDRVVVRCSSCHLCFCAPMPSGEDLADYYGEGDYDHGERQPTAQSPWNVHAMRARAQFELVARARGSVPSTWVDIGAGYGHLLDEVRRHGVSTVAVEPTPVRRDWLTGRGHRVVGSLDELDAPAPVISFSHVLEHVDDPCQFLDDVHGHLDRGGLAFCEVPNVQERSTAPLEPHVLFFESESLRRAFETSGFAVAHLSTAGYRRGSRWARKDPLRTAGRRLRLPGAVTAVHPSRRAFASDTDRMHLRCLARPA